MAATIKDIAQKTGLGLATISSYLNGGNVREKNRIKIEAAIEELHYEINEVARGLKTNRTKTIGVVIPELNNVFCSEIITEMEDVLRSHGYATMICDCRTDKQLEEEAVTFLMQKRVDGIINMPVDTTGAHLEAFRAAGKPVVLIDRKIKNLHCDSVFVDNRTASREAIELFIKNGHDKIGIIAGPEEIFTAQERFLGYTDALSAAGIRIKDNLIYHGNYTIQSGVEGVEKLVKDNPDMTAVFASNYEMTMGAVIGINELGISIPDDISVIGFDNLSFARACRPKLTIVTQPTETIGAEVARIMLERLENTEQHENMKLKTKIVEGKSVKMMEPKR